MFTEENIKELLLLTYYISYQTKFFKFWLMEITSVIIVSVVSLKGIFKPRPYLWHEIRSSTQISCAAAARVDDVIPVCRKPSISPPIAANNNYSAAMN